MYHAPALSSQGSPFAKINSQARKFGTESFWGSIFGPGVSVWFFSKPGDFKIGVLSFASIGSSPLLMTPHDHLQAHGTSAPEGNQNKLKWLQVTKFTLFQYNNS